MVRITRTTEDCGSGLQLGSQIGGSLLFCSLTKEEVKIFQGKILPENIIPSASFPNVIKLINYLPTGGKQGGAEVLHRHGSFILSEQKKDDP